MCNGSSSAVSTQTVTVVDREVDRPKIKARAIQKQEGKRIVVKVKAGAKEKVDVVATGTIKVRGKSKKTALTKVKKSVGAKKTKNFKLKTKQRSANRKIFKALDRRKRTKATLSVKLTDEVGNQLVRKVIVQLK